MYNAYFTMSESDAVSYTKDKLTIFPKEANLTCQEIGDGNLNYIFRVVDVHTDQSIIIKQSGPVARISDQFKLSPDRNRIEYEILKLQQELAPGLVPRVYHYDPIMNLTVMDDLSDYVIMRREMMAFKQFPLFVDHITDFMVNTLLSTSDVCMGHKEKKALVGNFINPELCEITEDLVYTEPFNDILSRNDVFEPNREWVNDHLYMDQTLRLETAKLKFAFMNHAQALVHGDLHTGSIFVKQEDTKIIDPEFAFYGPMGYDVGNVIANLIFAWANADAYGEAKHQLWLQDTIAQVIDTFKAKFLKRWETHATEVTANYQGFKEHYLSGVIEDTAGVTGLECIRRIVGIAHVKDLTSIQEPALRIRAERLVMTAGKRFILERHLIKTGQQFVQVLLESQL